jgi:hypothetical protein
MAIFVVINEEENIPLGNQKALKYPDEHLAISERLWLISAEKLTKQLAEDLGNRLSL